MLNFLWYVLVSQNQFFENISKIWSPREKFEIKNVPREISRKMYLEISLGPTISLESFLKKVKFSKFRNFYVGYLEQISWESKFFSFMSSTRMEK